MRKTSILSATLKKSTDSKEILFELFKDWPLPEKKRIFIIPTALQRICRLIAAWYATHGIEPFTTWKQTIKDLRNILNTLNEPKLHGILCIRGHRLPITSFVGFATSFAGFARNRLLAISSFTLALRTLRLDSKWTLVSQWWKLAADRWELNSNSSTAQWPSSSCYKYCPLHRDTKVSDVVVAAPLSCRPVCG